MSKTVEELLEEQNKLIAEQNELLRRNAVAAEAAVMSLYYDEMRARARRNTLLGGPIRRHGPDEDYGSTLPPLSLLIRVAAAMATPVHAIKTKPACIRGGDPLEDLTPTTAEGQFGSGYMQPLLPFGPASPSSHPLASSVLTSRGAAVRSDLSPMSHNGQIATQPRLIPDLLRRRFVACFLESRNAVEPRLCRLQLRGKRQQGRFFAVAAREMYADRQTIRRPVQRHAHRRRAGCVMQRCHRQIFRDAFGEGLNIAVLVEISEFRGRSGQCR
jgi:hypothetical protein